MTLEEPAGVSEEFDDEVGEQPYDPDDIPADREVVTTPYDAPVKSLLDDIRNKNLIVNPEFQRQSVWDRTRQSRLIESLLLNVPIPVLFLAEDQDGTRVVVDGQQRLRAIEEFEAGRYQLRGLQVLPTLNGKRWVDLTPRQSRIVLNRTLRCMVISAKSDPNLRFEVFERLNTGGVTLNDQELRNSIYRGPFNALLNEVVTSSTWLELIKRPAPDNRLQHHEMVLRFLSMRAKSTTYKPPLKAWLNDFMKEYRFAGESELAEFRNWVTQAGRGVQSVFQDSPSFRRARTINGRGDIEWDKTLNRPSFELQMLGLMDEDPVVLETRRGEILKAFADLCVNQDSFADALSRATADRSRTRLRMQLWAQALDGLGVVNRMAAMLPSVD
jgi:hypothetical protein